MLYCLFFRNLYEPNDTTDNKVREKKHDQRVKTGLYFFFKYKIQFEVYAVYKSLYLFFYFFIRI